MLKEIFSLHLGDPPRWTRCMRRSSLRLAPIPPVARHPPSPKRKRPPRTEAGVLWGGYVVAALRRDGRLGDDAGVRVLPDAGEPLGQVITNYLGVLHLQLAGIFHRAVEGQRRDVSLTSGL